ncbi:amidohydrolase [Microbacterium sp. VKM Ac-2923]|uniref:amidohydrolase family protein n=1 Tax=Microbacterium sp. VKM Ac-2923 TaxID=2929476 RepID=UPI001FB2748C|nr:amidohydrolase family protein [Microbacterium sp. VKM Ac-2923]MCJ1709033.1 amidohydrolase family protein [Microbacterium sp. VKM Ac-2923]
MQRRHPIVGPTQGTGTRTRVVDTHLHLWDPTRLSYTWLEGELDALHGPEELREAWRGRSAPDEYVFVQAECDAEQALDEVAWVSSLAPDCGVRGIVAHARLERGALELDTIDRLSAHPQVVGVRRLLQDEPAGFTSGAAFVEGAKLLAERRLAFDACVRSDALGEVAALADAVPELDVVLDHLGKPEVGSGARPVDPRGSRWHQDLVDLARRPSVRVKLSGLPAESRGPWTRAQIEPFLDIALEAFGPDRLVYGGDWPVSERRRPHAWLEAVTAWADDRVGPEGTDAVLAGNAERLYFS